VACCLCDFCEPFQPQSALAGVMFFSGFEGRVLEQNVSWHLVRQYFLKYMGI